MYSMFMCVFLLWQSLIVRCSGVECIVLKREFKMKSQRLKEKEYERVQVKQRVCVCSGGGYWEDKRASCF